MKTVVRYAFWALAMGAWAAVVPGCAMKRATHVTAGQDGQAGARGAPRGSLDRFVNGLPPEASPRVMPRLAAGEELWVIADVAWSGEPPVSSEPQRLETTLAGGGGAVSLPLTHTDVRAAVTGYVASVAVTQKYQNPYSEKIEAAYVFPLPENAAVKEFVMRIGSRRIRSIVRKRDDAEAIYGEARRKGYVAALLTEERPNVFRQVVGNIEPGKAIDIEITYFNTLRYDAGEFEFVFPMVVGPRYNPPGSTTGIGAVPAGQPGTSGQPTEVQYLRPGERSGHDVALRVELDAGMSIAEVTSPSHAIDVQKLSANRRVVTLRNLAAVPNKDFRLRYRVAGDVIKPALVTHGDQRGDFVSLLLVPPASLASLPRMPLELVFVVDCSQSMEGAPLLIAKGAIERTLRRLTADDTFQVINFSEDASALGPTPIAATPGNLERGLSYVNDLETGGGTNMITGIRAALEFPHDPRRMRIVSFLTDGFIGNESDILGEIHRRLGASRIFSFGIGSSTNRYLLEQMAVVGRGAAAFVGVDEVAARAVDAFYESAAHPVLTDVEIDWGGARVEDVYPARVPDMLVGRPVILAGRLRGSMPNAIKVRGKVGGRVEELTVKIEAGSAVKHEAVPDLWARAKIAELADEETQGESRAGDITEIALNFGLASAYTAFVAVDSSKRTAGDYGTTIEQPVPMPEGTRYDTTVAPAERGR